MEERFLIYYICQDSRFMRKSRIFILLMVLVLVLSMVACKKTPVDDETPKYKTQMLENWTEYSIVYAVAFCE